jgi:hypothetical protein
MANRRQIKSSVAGRFTPSALTDAMWAEAREAAAELGVVSCFLIGELPNGTPAVVPINMASINHMMELGDRALNSLPDWERVR